MISKSKDLDFNTRINHFIIKSYSLYFKIVKYRFNQKEYAVLIYGKDNKVYAPIDTYPQEIENKKYKNLGKNEVDDTSKKRLVSFVLCLFLGLFGIHRFYVGKIKSGLLQILLPFFTIILIAITELDVLAMSLLFCLIWYCVDLFSILFGKFKDKDKNYIKKWI